jgi:hypothetical protein
MHRAYKPLLLSLTLACVAVIAIVHAPMASADAAAADPDTNDDNPELRVVSVVHGMTFTLNQREVVPGTQGPTIMITHVHAAIPPGPPQIDLVVRLTAPDMEIAHAAGALTALGLMHGLSLQQITTTFAQLNWGIQIKNVKGQVDQSSLIDTTKAGALAELTISAIIAGDRPGGGCDAAIPFIEQGAAALGFAPTCALPNAQ